MPTSASGPLVALQHRNFRLLWTGLLLSLSGSYMQNAALLWHVSTLVSPGRKALALGMVGLVKVVPIFTLSMVAGVVADAWDRRRLMLLTQVASTLVSLGLAWTAFHHVTAVWPIYLLAGLGAAAGAFDPPARHSLVPMLVPRAHLPSAISLNSAMMQTASIIGPSLGGVMMAVGGVGWAYLANAASFMAVIVAVLRLRDVPASQPGDGARQRISWAAALEGIRFVFTSPTIRGTMLLDFCATFFSSATGLLPLFAQDVLHVGAAGYGWLYSAPATGAVLASVVMVTIMPRLSRRGAVLFWAVAAYGAATVGFGLSRSFILSFLCLALTGAADTVSTAIRSILRQLETPDRLRGRMIGVNMLFVQGGPQLGELEAGLVANAFGAVTSVVSGGVGCLIATAALAFATPSLVRYRATTPVRDA